MGSEVLQFIEGQMLRGVFLDLGVRGQCYRALRGFAQKHYSKPCLQFLFYFRVLVEGVVGFFVPSALIGFFLAFPSLLETATTASCK